MYMDFDVDVFSQLVDLKEENEQQNNDSTKNGCFNPNIIRRNSCNAAGVFCRFLEAIILNYKVFNKTIFF